MSRILALFALCLSIALAQYTPPRNGGSATSVPASGVTPGTYPSGNYVYQGNLSVSTALLAPVTISTSGPVTVSTWGFYLNNASGALTYTLPTITSTLVGIQMCFRNAATKTGAITLTSPASTFIDLSGTNGSSAGTLVSGGALGDSVCVVATSTTQYVAYVGSGAWTNN